MMRFQAFSMVVGLSVLAGAVAAQSLPVQSGEKDAAPGAQPVASMGRSSPDDPKDRYLVLLMMRHKTDNGSSIFRFAFPQAPQYERLVNETVSRVGPPKTFLGRMMCGDMDPVACAKARPDRGSSLYIDIPYEGDPEGAWPLLKDFFLKCNLPFGQNPCIYGEFVGLKDERLLEEIPPGARYAILARGSYGDDRVGQYGFGAAIALCYGSCQKREAILDELFWHGVVPMIRTPWISEEDRPSINTVNTQVEVTE